MVNRPQVLFRKMVWCWSEPHCPEGLMLKRVVMQEGRRQASQGAGYEAWWISSLSQFPHSTCQGIFLAAAYSASVCKDNFFPFFKINIICWFERGGRGRETSICCSTYPCTHWLTLACALTRNQTHNLDVSGKPSNQLSYWSGLAPFIHFIKYVC